MQHKQGLLVSLLLLIITGYHLLAANPVHADSAKIDELVPNDYQENQFKKNNELLHDESLTNQRTNIPEEVKDLTFEREKQSQDDIMKSTLFLSETSDNNTIKAKALEMQLFTNVEDKALNLAEEDEPSSSNLSLTIFIWTLVGVCSLLLIVVLFVWGSSQNKTKKSSKLVEG
ncbi:type VII secretion protein EssA [Metabacillus sp. Hm71]|uniref:type VII secretion protein EssA n=1 Tax=Metabacillus sp. Hm71 TaxID=3450743 RepID=UPI003F41CBE6